MDIRKSKNHAETIKILTQAFLKEGTSNVVLSQGIDDGFYETLKGISKKYPKQCFDLPCSENASVGMSLGAATYGLTPILCFQRVEFALLALEQLINNSSKYYFLAGGRRRNSCLFRFVIGRGWGQGPSHSQSLEGIFAQIPDVKVYLPVFPEDSRYVFNTFSAGKAPSISLEHRWIHFSKPSLISVKSNSPYVVKEGSDVSIVATSYYVLLCSKIAYKANEIGVSLEVINLFCISPLDIKVIMDSANKTKRLICIDLNNTGSYSTSSEVIASVTLAGLKLSCPPQNLHSHSSYTPSSPFLASQHYLNCEDIGKAISNVLDLDASRKEKLIRLCKSLDKTNHSDVPSELFQGPF